MYSFFQCIHIQYTYMGGEKLLFWYFHKKGKFDKFLIDAEQITFLLQKAWKT